MFSARLARAGLRASAQVSVPRPAVNGLRAYASAAQEVKPPVSLYGVDGTYATALVCFPHPDRVTISTRDPLSRKPFNITTDNLYQDHHQHAKRVPYN